MVGDVLDAREGRAMNDRDQRQGQVSEDARARDLLREQWALLRGLPAVAWIVLVDSWVATG